MADIDRTVPITGTPASKEAVRSNWGAIDDRVGTLPDSYTSLANVLIAVNAEGTGPEPVEGGLLDVRNCRVAGAGWAETELTASRNARDNTADPNLNDRGKVLFYDGSSNIAINFTTDDGTATYVSSGFVCRLWRLGGGKLRVTAGAGLTLSNPDGHTYVMSGRMAEVFVSSQGLLAFDGNTEAS